MTPEELAQRHPKLYHLTHPGASAGVARHGLLSTQRLSELFEVPRQRRDNLPLSEAAA